MFFCKEMVVMVNFVQFFAVSLMVFSVLFLCNV